MPPSRVPFRVSPAFRRLGIWGGRLLLVLYFVAALLILVGRHFLMPELENQRELVEQRLSAAIGLPVKMRGLAASWPGLHPHLAIDGMQILDADGRSALAFDRVEAEIGWSSLWHFGLRLHRLEIHAPTLDIRRDAAGTIYVAGLPMLGDGDGAFAEWLLDQGRIAVRDARLIWHDELRAAPPLELRELNFELRNAGRHHSFGLRARPPEGVAAHLDLRGNLVGSDLADLASWRGEIYADLERAEVAAWTPWLDLPVEWTRGNGGLRVWLDFYELTPTGFTAELRLSDVAVRLRPDLPVLDLDYLDGRLGGRLQGRQGADGFSGEIRRLMLATRSGIVLAPADARIAVDTRKGRETGELHASGLDIGAMTALAGYLPFPSSIHEQLHSLAPRGTLSDIELDWHGPVQAPERWRAKGRFDALAMTAWRELPGFAGFSGSIEGDEKAGTIRIDSRDVRIELPSVFPEPVLSLAALAGEIGWRARGGATDLLLSRIVFHNDDARGEATGSYRHTGAGPGEIDLSAKLTQAAGNAVWRYMPLVVNEDARDWLRAGIVGGRSETASLRLKGPLADFPFRGGKTGIFQVRGTIRGATLNLAPGWPRMTGIDGELLFENERMAIRGQRAEIMGVALSDILAEIADLEAEEEILLVSGRAQGRTQQFLDFIEASPVGEMIDHFTQPMQANGNGDLDLKLKMPLRRVADTEIDGRYRFSGNELRVLPELPVFSAAQGELGFTAERLEAKNLRARFLGAPVVADVTTGAGGVVRVTANGRLAAQALRRQPEFEGMRALDHLSGETAWRASVTVKKPGAEIRIDSGFEGLSSSLPDPFNKSVRTAMPLKVVGRIDPRGDEWTATLGDALDLRLAQSDGRWRGRLAVGAAAPANAVALPERGLALAIVQPSLDIDAWRSLLTTQGGAGSGAMPPLAGVDLRAAEARLLGRTFHDLQLNGSQQGGIWRIALDSREAQGRLNWDGAGAGRLSGRLSRLLLPATDGAKTALAADELDELPAVELSIDNFRLRDMAFGELRIAAENDVNGWQAKFNIVNDAARLSGESRWQPRAQTPGSTLDFNLDIVNAEKLLGRLGMHDAVRRGAGRIEGSLAWNGSPFAFELPRLSGQIKADVEKGQFKKLEPGVGRLLGVLSLQSLPRRISLDFRDVFSEGFAFDSIVGAASIARGTMHTDELRIDGPAARVELSGDVDLSRETQNLKVRVRPSIGDTVSTGAMLVNPVAGAVVWLAQKALNDPFGQAFAYEYAVTGGWADPKVEKIGVKPPAGAEAPQ